MGRQILRNMKDPNSIWVRATKVKYGYGGSVWRMKQTKGCSQSWSSILQGAEVVTDGLKWEIGDGTRINVLEEPWIDTVPLAKSSIFIRDEENLQGVSVSHFIKDIKSCFFNYLTKLYSTDAY